MHSFSVYGIKSPWTTKEWTVYIPKATEGRPRWPFSWKWWEHRWIWITISWELIEIAKIILKAKFANRTALPFGCLGGQKVVFWLPSRFFGSQKKVLASEQYFGLFWLPRDFEANVGFLCTENGFWASKMQKISSTFFCLLLLLIKLNSMLQR